MILDEDEHLVKELEKRKRENELVLRRKWFNKIMYIIFYWTLVFTLVVCFVLCARALAMMFGVDSTKFFKAFALLFLMAMFAGMIKAIT